MRRPVPALAVRARRRAALTSAALVVALLVASVTMVAAAAGRRGGARGGQPRPPAPSQASQPNGDFAHTPFQEQKVNTPLPLSFEYPGSESLSRVTVKYAGAQASDWKKLELKHVGDAWVGTIPCADVTLGPLRYWVLGLDEGGDPVATSGDTKNPFIVNIVDEITGEPPHLPGQSPPRSCDASGNSPPDTGAAAGSSDESTEETEGEAKPHAKKRKATPEEEKALEDTSSKHASLEVAEYNDSDHVTVFTPSVNVGVDNVSGASLSGTYLVDVVSAASADIVSTASRRWEEVRQAGTLTTQYKPHDFGVGIGGSVSSEPDYLSYGAYGNIVKDFAEKNWTAVFGYGFSHDTIGRCGAGGACTPTSVFSRDLQRGAFNGSIGWVVDKESLASLTGDLVIENGDQSKPYRYIPMFSPTVAPNVPKGASIDWVNANRLPERPLEQLPLGRRRFALTGRYAHRFDGSTLRLEQRFYDDSWGLFASSTDARWIFDLGRRFALWPHMRFHGQSAVTFWKRAYVSEAATGWNLPEYRTGDRELGPLVSFEGGGGIRWYMGGDSDPQKFMLQLTGDAMYSSYLDDLYLTDRTAILGALVFEGRL
jgi:hypothetical protein